MPHRQQESRAVRPSKVGQPPGSKHQAVGGDPDQGARLIEMNPAI